MRHLALALTACREPASQPPPSAGPTPTASLSATPPPLAGPRGAPADPLAMDEENAAAAREVVEAIVRAARSRLRLDSCGMDPGTRAGRCLLSGTSDDVARFVEALHLPERDLSGDARPASDPNGCLALAEFGVRHHEEDGNGDRFDRLVARPGTRSFGPGASLPPNDRNVHVRRFYLSPARDAVCLAFDYPYG